MDSSSVSCSSPEETPVRIVVLSLKKPKKSARKVLFMGVLQDSKSIPKKKEKKSKKMRVEKARAPARKAFMISEAPFQPFVPQYYPTMVSNQIHSQFREVPYVNNNIKNTNIYNFLDDFNDHIPSSFDIIQRGNLPGMKLSPIIY